MGSIVDSPLFAAVFTATVMLLASWIVRSNKTQRAGGVGEERISDLVRRVESLEEDRVSERDFTSLSRRIDDIKRDFSQRLDDIRQDLRDIKLQGVAKELV